MFNPEAELNTFCIRDRISHSTEKNNSSITVIDYKFYQKLFLVLISLTTILIFPEFPKEAEILCETYHSKKICNVW